ncbi:MAG: UDP-N-acetylmuramoyl-L-alanine--D-glutamate ligase, partial [Kiritimatiellales bacterium]|nr:UDP-N-acetylmuramoyl-L-alanine--D-glutamate ligase [Kiritimatiellales bacterium]
APSMAFQKNSYLCYMQITELKGKNICILGYGREGHAMLNALRGLDVDVIIADKNSEFRIQNSELINYNCKLGPDYLNNIEEFDVIIKSPGIPPCKELEDIKEKVTSSTQIFLDSIASTGAKVIGVTGSKGKSTTASLIYEILKAADKDVHLIGNIGEPAISHLADSKEGTIFVMEMSSYQLMDLTVSPHIAVITSFFPEHLDYHGSKENYLEAKKHITQFQTEDDSVFFNGDSPESKEIAEESKGKLVPVYAKDSVVSLDQINLIGEHNLSNVTLAYMTAKNLNITEEIIINTIKSFKGLPHRLQSLGIHNGIEWIDDSISTTPETTIVALDALDNVTTLILGGQDRGNDFSGLGRRIASSKIQNIILIGESAPRIKKAIEETNAEVTFSEVNNMKEAVEHAKQQTPSPSPSPNPNPTPNPQPPIVLLSPASPSYDMFKNFEERGDAFRKCINS